ncbi:universal stress protein [Spirabiliibacterium falconis]|uniref:universal stress protein n=1 Tax=Spirabiliibacterium falconis TaxID=572023 RepID=UPI001AAC645D|nr:universal stress protein [Spirabiliibacterium falconis]MBE2894162.1 universal stress protein [Spirabiliibacterium falconis]
MFNNILIVIDLSHLNEARRLIQTALDMTEHQEKTVYRVAGIVPAPTNSIVSSFLPKNFDKDVLAEANKKLHEFTQGIFPEGKKVQHIVAYGTVYEEVNRIAEEKDVDLIMMMATQKARQKQKKEGLSSDTVKVARYSHRPVLVMR